MLLALLLSCGREETPTEGDAGAAAEAHTEAETASVPVEAAAVEAGRRLFYDARLAVDGQTSCATCHVQARAFTDPRGVSVGATGEPLRRQAMTLDRAGELGRLTWANPHLDSLQSQALIPLFTDAPVEIGAANREQEVLDVLTADPVYAALLDRWRPGAQAWTWTDVVASLAAFQATIVSENTAWDRFLAGDAEALDPTQREGWQRFGALGCADCHIPPSFTDATVGAGGEVPMHRIRASDGPDDDTGLAEITHDPADRWRYRTPTLRHAPDTAPYLHDGSAATLADAIRAHDGVVTDLSDADVAQLVTFLGALSDPVVRSSAAYSDPWATGPTRPTSYRPSTETSSGAVR